MNKLPQISEAELEVMKIVWQYEPISTNEIIQKLARVSSWSPKTIQTLLIRLEKKGALTHEKEGMVFVYSARIPQDIYLAQESHALLNRLYDGTLNKMVVNLLEQELLSQEDLAELRLLLDKNQQKQGE